MFQEKDRMEYVNRKAPDELKNRTWSSIQQEKKRQRKQGMYLAACFAGALLMGNVMYQNSTIVKVNDVPVSYLSVNVGTESGDIPYTASEGRNKEIQSEIPMEIDIEGNAHIEVSAGTIRTEKNSETSESEATELDIQGETVVVWNMEGEKDSIAICTITTETKVYQYVMELDEAGCKLRLKTKN